MHQKILTRSAASWSNEYVALEADLLRWNCPIPPGSRLYRFSRLNEEFRDGRITVMGPADRLGSLLETARDFAEFQTIAQAFRDVRDPVFIQKLRSALGGTDMPAQDTKTLARDTQFELYVAALLRRAGHDVHLLEPDIRFTLGTTELGIAAKRLQSARKYGSRLSEAVRQLERAKLPGLVAISLDRLLPPASLRGADIQTLASHSPIAVNTILEPFRDVTLRAVAGKRVLAIVGSVVATAIAPPDNSLGRVASLLVRVIESNVTPEEYAALIELSTKLGPPNA